MSKLSPRRKRQVLSGLLSLVLVSTALGAVFVVGAERTALDADTVTDSLESENVYDELATEMTGEFQPDNGSGTASAGLSGTAAPPVDEVAESVVTTEYVRGEVEGSVEALYAYLHGDRDDLALAIDLMPVRDGFAAEYEQWVREAPVAELEPDWDVEGANFSMAALAANESQFQATREDFEDDQLQRIQERTPRERTRAELEEIYDDHREQIRDDVVSRLEREVTSQGTPEPLHEPMVAYVTVGVDALVAEETSYEAFMREEDGARERLATAVGDVVRDRLAEEVPREMNLSGEMDQNAQRGLAQARLAVSIADLLVYVLPIAALVSAGLLAVLFRHRRSSALWRVGGALAAAGSLGFVATVVLSALVSGVIDADGGDPSAIGQAMLSVADTTIRTIGAQSLVVLALGLVLLGAGVAVRRDLLPIEDEPAVN